MALIEQLGPGRTAVAIPQVDERAARRTLRDQIARLERELASACLDACPRIVESPPTPSPRALAAGPRLLTLGELEHVRDTLAGRLARVREEADAQLLRQAESRALLERMFEAPGDHKWIRVSNAQLGEPGCKHFHVRPRLGPIGLLAGWWHVKVSSGCPLASAP
jgi:hypothetical protein